MELTNVNKRIQEYIDYRCNGNKSDFARPLGWSSNYTCKMLRGESIGLSPITDILATYKDINARWLMFGTGTMVDAPSKRILSAISQLMEIEKYMPVMTPDELRQVELGNYDATNEQVASWKLKLKAKNADLLAEIKRAEIG